MKPKIHFTLLRSRGFTLVELMVGVTIGLITSLVIVQVFSNYEGQRRTTTSGSEAQENGLMALTQMEQDIHNAGAGFLDLNTLSCNSIYTYLDGGSGSSIPSFSLAPVSILDGASGASDTVTVRTGTDFLGTIPATITSSMPASSSEFNVNNPSVFSDGDLSIVIQGGNCTLQNVTQVQVASKKIQHNPGNSAPNNPPNSWKNANGWPGYTTGAIVKAMSPITAREYSIDSNNSLRMIATNVTSGAIAPTETLTRDIVSLQAQYGIAPTGSQIVNQWVNASGGTWATPSTINMKRIKAVRLVLVARSGKKEGSNVTTACANNANGPCAWQDIAGSPAPLIDLSGDPDWQRYRYKVYQTIIPLRNMIWANV